MEILATPTGPLGSTIASARKALTGLHLPPGYRIGFGGLYPQLESAALGLGAAAIAAFLLMLAIMVLQFDGLLVPGLLLLLIPLAFTGGAAALVLANTCHCRSSWIVGRPKGDASQCMFIATYT